MAVTETRLGEFGIRLGCDMNAAARSEFGLQGGLFTNDLHFVEAAFDRIDVGGLMVDDVSTFRIDHMPYGRGEELRLRPRGPSVRDRGDDGMKLLAINPRPRTKTDRGTSIKEGR